jgi:hypothetical protein
MTDVQPIPVYRPTFLTDGGEFRGSLIESPSNIFYQKVSASRATLNRLQFQWRSVSDNLLLSPTVMLRMKLKITCPQVWDHISSILSVHGSLGLKSGNNANVYEATEFTIGQNFTPCLVFADGDAFSSVCSSANLIFNGTSISLNRQNRFWRDWMRTQVACEDAARIYKACGGSYDKYDQRPVSVPGTTGGAAFDGNGVVTNYACGITQDSGINERSRCLYAMSATGKNSDATVAADGFTARVIQVSYPVPLPPFNPWRGHSLPASCPYKSCPLAIPHLSSGSLDFLLEDFQKAFLRRLGDVARGGAAGNNISANTCTKPVSIEVVEGDTYVELKYFRLSHSRALKESYRFAIWQAQTFLGQPPPTSVDPDKGFIDVGHATGGLFAMAPVGKDNSTKAGVGASSIGADNSGKTWKVQFDTLNLAQIPSFLLISAPKLTDSYTMESEYSQQNNNTGGRPPNCVRNLSRNLYIKQIRIIVNSARGAIEKSSDVDTGFIDAERLWQMTRENCNSKYFAEGGFRAWRDFGCALLLSSPQFAPGLQACDGVAYPVQIQIEMVLENRAVDVSALAMCGGGINVHSLANTGIKTCHRLQADYIRAQAQCTAFYQKVVLATTETSASVNAMNYPLASAERLLNAAGSRF